MTDLSQPCLIYLTTSDEAEARRIAEALLEHRLIACANLLGGITSLYVWQGERQEGKEVAVLLKTTLARRDDVVAAIQAMHRYECPCIVTLPVEGGHAPFLQWIQDQVA